MDSQHSLVLDGARKQSALTRAFAAPVSTVLVHR